MLRAGLSFVDTSDIFGAIGERLLSMECTMFTSHTLDKDLGVLIDEHVRLSLGGIGESPLQICENALRAA
jgi:hypothetical protein